MKMDIHEILRKLPHRYPIILVDRVLELVPGERVVALKNVTINEPYFMGHFPGHPVMPGVLIIEAIAQTGALLMSKTLDVDIERTTIFFMSVDGARFRHPVRPGDMLRMPVEVTRARGDVFKFRGRAMVGDKMVAECEFAAMKGDKPQ